MPRDYVPCSFCGGGSASGPGCMACFLARQKKTKELDEEYKREFPDGPQPIFTARFDNPAEMEELKEIFHADKITAAFSEGGVESIVEKATAAMKKRTKE